MVHLKRLAQSHGPTGATPNNIALKLGGDVDGDLTSLDWNATGTLLAVGCYDHKVRVVTSNGQLHMEGAMHRVTSILFPSRHSAYRINSRPYSLLGSRKTDTGWCPQAWIMPPAFGT